MSELWWPVTIQPYVDFRIDSNGGRRGGEMLAIVFVNDLTGSIDIGNYDYKVMINDDVIHTGRVKGHIRDNGWEGLVLKLAKTLERKSTHGHGKDFQ